MSTIKFDLRNPIWLENFGIWVNTKWGQGCPPPPDQSFYYNGRTFIKTTFYPNTFVVKPNKKLPFKVILGFLRVSKKYNCPNVLINIIVEFSMSKCTVCKKVDITCIHKVNNHYPYSYYIKNRNTTTYVCRPKIKTINPCDYTTLTQRNSYERKRLRYDRLKSIRLNGYNNYRRSTSPAWSITAEHGNISDSDSDSGLIPPYLYSGRNNISKLIT